VAGASALLVLLVLAATVVWSLASRCAGVGPAGADAGSRTLVKPPEGMRSASTDSMTGRPAAAAAAAAGLLTEMLRGMLPMLLLPSLVVVVV
jgi:hypothetical protein